LPDEKYTLIKKVRTNKKSAKHNTELNKQNQEPSMATLDLLFIFMCLKGVKNE